MKKKHIEDIYQLSPMQEGILFHSLYALDNQEYFLQLSFSLHSHLNIKAFERAWQQVVARHTAMRSAFYWKGQDKPLQVVYRQVKLPTEIYSWRGLDPHQQQQQLETILQSDRQRGFQLSEAPLMRLTLIQMEEEVYQFVWSCHHIWIDGWSLPLVFKEFLTFYEAFCQGQELHLEPSRSYREYIVWLQQQNLALAEEFWRSVLKGFTAPTPLVVDRAPLNLSHESERHGEQQIQLSAAATAALQSFSRHHQLTVSTLIQGAWALLLSRYSGETDVVFGVVVSGRPPAIIGVESIVGLFINTLPMRVMVSDDDSVLSWLKFLQHQQVEMSQYDYSPLVEIQGWSKVPRDLPLFESIVVFENYPIDPASQQGILNLDLSNVRSFDRTNYPLALIGGMSREQLSLRLSYDSHRFEAATISRMLGHFQTLLLGIAAHPEERLLALPLLSEPEQQQLLEEWNNTQVEYPQNACIHQLFEAQVEQTPDVVAVVFENRQLTYRELNAQANQLAHHLRNLGVGSDHLVGLCLERSLEMIVGILGILKAGGAYVPLDPQLPSERLWLMLAEVTVLLSQQLHLERLPEHKAQVLCIDSSKEVIAKQTQENPISRATPENLIYVTYPSKQGVLVEHQAVSQRLQWLQNTFVLSESDVVLHKAPLSQDTAVWEIFWPLVVGGRLLIADAYSQDNPADLQSLMLEQKVSIVGFVPRDLSAFVASLSGDKKAQLSSLRLVLCSGEPLRHSVVKGFKEHFTGELHNQISLPEAAGELTSFACESLGTQQTVLSGYPSYRAIYVLDQHLQPVPIGVKGEIYVGGTGLARGYLQAEEETAQRFVNNPFMKNPNARLFKTGELGRYLNDGTLEWLGSNNRQTWIKGERVELQAVEAALLALTAVEDARVLVRETEKNEPQLVAYVVLKGPFFPEQLHSELQSVLPADQLPCAYVPLSTLPLTLVGEVDELALSGLEVIDSELVQRWEKQLISLPEIDQVAVVVQEQVQSQPPLHLMDLLADSQADFGKRSDLQTPILTYPEVSNGKSASTTLAISDGGPLPLFVNLPTNLAQALHRAAQHSPTKGIVYIQSDGSEISQSYRELLQQAQRIQAGLTNRGLKPQDKVIFQLEHNQDFIPAFWGCVLGGFVPIPIAVAPTYEEHNSTTSKLLNAWLMLGRPLVLTTAKLAEVIRCWSEGSNLENFQLAKVDELHCCEPDDNWYDSQPDDLAILLLTSGSTGIPKAVMQSHRALLSRSAASAVVNHFTSIDVSLNWFPLDHVGGLVMFHIRDVYVGCQHISAPIQLVLQNPLKWLDWIERYRATITWAPNFAYGLINDRASDVTKGCWDLSSMRFILNGGEAIVAKHARKFLQLLAPHGLSTTVMHPSWGMSETSSGVVFSNFLLSTTTDEQKFVEVGAPIPGVSLRIVDELGHVVEEETIGRMQINGDPVTSGYYQNPKLNQEVFTLDGWFNTGDLGFLRKGCLTITGRDKDIIIINGLNYYSHEIESAVEELDGIEVSYTAAVAVRGAFDHTDKLTIFFSPAVADEAEVVNLTQEIRRQVVQSIGVNPEYLVPVDKQVIPKTAIGKIQRSQLRQRFEAGEFNDILKQLDLQSANAKTLPDWFYRKIWCRKEDVTITPFTHLAQSLVFLDPLGVGEYLCAQLEQLNQPCVKVEVGSEFAQLAAHHYRLAPGNPNHYQQLLLSLVTDNIHITQILHLWNYHEYSEVSSLEALFVAQEKGVYSLLFLVQALAKVQSSQHQVRLLVISSDTQAVSPLDAIAYEKATILGLLKTIPQEMPWLSCCHVDLPPSSDVQWNGERILNELRVLSKEKEVAYRDGQRWVCRLEKADLCVQPNLELPFQQGGMYLLSGGLGGIGIEIAKYLLQHYQAKLLLVGRTPLPERSTWDAYVQQTNTIAEKIKAIQALEQFGGEILYHAVDICDLTQMQLLVAQAQSHWQCQLHGVIHLAGTYHESKLIDETQDSVSATLAPKVLGSWVLHQLLQHQPNSIFINFSSVNGFLGGTNVGAYAAANSFLDSFAQYQKYNTSLQSYCLAWSMWDEIGMSRGYEMKELTRARGYYIITAQQGLYSVLASLHHDQAQLLVGLDSRNRNLRRYMQSESYGIQKLTAYFTTNRNVSSRASFQELMVRDRFGTQSKSEFVQIEEMPLTNTGEIDREQLLTLGTSGRSGDSSRVEPRTEIERQLASIWQQVLRVPVLGIHDNFFELGGHSLLATQLISRVQDVFELELPLRSLFENPTVAELASDIAVAQSQTRVVESFAIEPLARNSELPLSFAQARLWFLDQLMPLNPFYNIPFALRLAGELDILVLQSSLNEIIRRHETLRTSFKTVNGQPTQLIAESLELKLAAIDLQLLPKLEREQKERELASQLAQQPFDLRVAPLMRVTLLRLAPTEHVLLFVMHHIISDGWSMGVFHRELAVLYDTFVTGKTSPLPELSIQYADFAVWQRTWLELSALKNQLLYWQQQLAELAVLQLPTDYPRPAEQSFRGAVEILSLPLNLKQGLVKLSQQHGFTLFMTLLAVFKVLLYRYTGQTDLVVGSPIANRNRSEIEPLIGFFVNTLVLRTQIQGNLHFDELLTRVQEVALGAYAHQDLPFERLVEELQPERHLNTNPLVQVIFALQNAPMEELQLKGLQLSRLELEYKTTRLDMEWHVWEQPQGLQVMVAYATDLFAQETIKRMLGHFQNLLSGVIANPQQQIWELPLLSATQQQQLLVKWNDTVMEYPHHKCTNELFEAQVERTPDAVALVFEDQQLTYHELNVRANQLAHYLQSMGVAPEVLVGLCVERSIEMVVGLLGILKAGGVYVPIDPNYPQERLSFILSDAQVLLLLTQQRLIEKLPEHGAVVICLDTNWYNIIQKSKNNPVSHVTSDNLAYIIYTSGSTGKPKGVQISHGALVNFLSTMRQKPGMTAKDQVLGLTTFTFDMAGLELFLPISVGACLVIARREVASNGIELLDLLVRSGVTLMQATPATWQLLLEAGWPSSNQLKILCGGEALPSELAKQLQARSSFLWHLYGPTETTIWSTTYHIESEESLICIGRPIANTQVYILDRYLQPVPIGVPGELHIGGAGLARGYLNRLELTAEKFIPNPFSDQPGTRLYKTGDLAHYLPNGNIQLLGRIDNQVKIRGFRIELGEIEANLSQHPDVRQTVVIAREDVPGDQRLVAYIVPHQESAPTISDLRSFLRDKLPEYMIPSAIVMLDSLPLTPNGKLDREALPAPERVAAEQQDAFVAPRDILELQLAQIWEKVLNTKPVGVKDNFFDLGGHSLLAVRLIAEIQKQCGQSLPLTTLFQAATIEELTSVLRQQISFPVWFPLVEIQPRGSQRPLFCVHPGGGNVFHYYHLAQSLGSDQPFYGFQALGLDGQQEPHTTVEDTAACYIEAMRAVQPEGPYLLAGWSYGGLVAYEIALQLLARGQRVAFLGLLDTHVTPELDKKGSFEDYYKDDATILVEIFQDVCPFSLEHIQKLAPSEQLLYIAEHLRQANLFGSDFGLTQVRFFIKVLRSQFLAVQRYVPKPYTGGVTLLRVAPEHSIVSLGPTNGWDALAAGVDVHIVPGTHVSMMFKPNVQVLAEKLKRCLEQAQAEN